MEQISNIGSEIEKTISWRDKKKGYIISAIERTLELFHLRTNDDKNRKLPKSIKLTCLRDALIEYFFLDN